MAKKTKRNRMNLIISLLIIIVIVIANSACESNGREDKNTANGSEQITLKWMIFGEKSKSSDSVIATFNENLQEYYPNMAIEFDIVPIADYKEKWDMVMATNEKVDLVWIGNDIFNYTEEVKKGSFMALDYLLSTDGANLTEQISTDLWAKQTREGKIYSVPLLGAL
jgi:ABC-type glycerol-3-phosphate transport system substrate-binding protein